MSFSLVPRRGEAREVNVWVWRPTLELIREAKLIDKETYRVLGFNDGGKIDAKTARSIAKLVDQTVEKMGPKDRLLIDLSITIKPQKRGYIKTPEDVMASYSVGRKWLKDFGQFSRDSSGFRVY